MNTFYVRALFNFIVGWNRQLLHGCGTC